MKQNVRACSENTRSIKQDTRDTKQSVVNIESHMFQYNTGMNSLTNYVKVSSYSFFLSIFFIFIHLLSVYFRWRRWISTTSSLSRPMNSWRSSSKKMRSMRTGKSNSTQFFCPLWPRLSQNLETQFWKRCLTILSWLRTDGLLLSKYIIYYILI